MGSVTAASGHLLLALGPRELNSDSRVTVAATRGQRQGSEPEAREALATGRANHRNRDRGRGQECVLKVRSDD